MSEDYDLIQSKIPASTSTPHLLSLHVCFSMREQRTALPTVLTKGLECYLCLSHGIVSSHKPVRSTPATLAHALAASMSLLQFVHTAVEFVRLNGDIVILEIEFDRTGVDWVLSKVGRLTELFPATMESGAGLFSLGGV
jgi:hypothetical protein